MKKLLSLVLVAMMLLTLAGAALADDSAKSPAAGGFDLNPYDGDAKAANGIATEALPAWFQARIQKAAEEMPIFRFSYIFDCCLYCLFAGDECEGECGYFVFYPCVASGTYGAENYSFEFLAPDEWTVCGVEGCPCMDITAADLLAAQNAIIDDEVAEDFYAWCTDKGLSGTNVRDLTFFFPSR